MCELELKRNYVVCIKDTRTNDYFHSTAIGFEKLICRYTLTIYMATCLLIHLVEECITVMHQSIPAVPIPPPRAIVGHFPALSIPGVGH